MTTPKTLPWKSKAGRYTLLGVLGGLLFPIAASFLALWEKSIPVDLDSILALQKSSSLMWIIDTAPLLLGILANRAGRKQDSLYSIQLNLTTLAARKMTEARQAHQNQIMLNSLLGIGLENLSLKEQLERCLDVILSNTAIHILPMGGIFLTDENEPNVLRLTAHRNLSEALLGSCERVPFGYCLCGRAASYGKTNFTSKMDKNHEIRCEGMQPHGHYNIPIMLSREVLGMIVLYVKEGHEENPREVASLEAAANTLSGIIQRKRLENQIRLQSIALQEPRSLPLTPAKLQRRMR